MSNAMLDISKQDITSHEHFSTCLLRPTIRKNYTTDAGYVRDFKNRVMRKRKSVFKLILCSLTTNITLSY